MADLILSDVQAEVVAASVSPISVLDDTGKLIGYLQTVINDPHFSANDIAAAKAAFRAPGPRHTLADVIGHLNSLAKR